MAVKIFGRLFSFSRLQTIVFVPILATAVADSALE
jgi:hypothetical protein